MLDIENIEIRQMLMLMVMLIENHMNKDVSREKECGGEEEPVVRRVKYAPVVGDWRPFLSSDIIQTRPFAIPN